MFGITSNLQKALFVTFEGIDACGKSTQIRLLHDYLAQRGQNVVQVRDPGSTGVSEAVRAILLDHAYRDMSPWAELLLYEAARAQLVQEAILPALSQGTVVLCDRFYDSTTAYQGYARGLDLESVRQANVLGSCGLTPDATFFVDVDPIIAAQRKAAQGGRTDRIEAEGLEFQRRVRAGYVAIQAAEPQRMYLIDGRRTVTEIHQQIVQIFLQRQQL